MIDPWTVVIWSIGVVAMMATAWIQDRREIRREDGQFKTLRDEFAEAIDLLKKDNRELHNELKRMRVRLVHKDDE